MYSASRQHVRRGNVVSLIEISSMDVFTRYAQHHSKTLVTARKAAGHYFVVILRVFTFFDAVRKARNYRVRVRERAQRPSIKAHALAVCLTWSRRINKVVGHIKMKYFDI